MRRDLNALTDKEFDVLVVGGGIHGAAIAYDAASRGLRVALIEKNDFGSATSSNSLKTVHGGLRYLQHADFRRMRESIRERRILLRIAPHLVYPLQFVIPTHGHLIKGPEVLRIALMLNDLIGWDRNRGLPPHRRLPRGRILSADDFRRLVPVVEGDNISGGASWYDAQMYSSERLLLAFVQSAVEEGAVVANYLQAVGYPRRNGRVLGVEARDQLSGDSLEIRSRLVINACGPWYNDLLHKLGVRNDPKPVQWSVAINLVTRKQLTRDYAIGFYSRRRYSDEDAWLPKGSRLLIIAPWREANLIGTAHLPYLRQPDAFTVDPAALDNFLQEVKEAIPKADLTARDVCFYNAGLLPMSSYNPKTGDVTLTKHHEVVDHQKRHGIAGVLSLIGVKYTTARGVAEQVIDLAVRKLGTKARKCQTAHFPLFGGEMGDFEEFLRTERPRLQQFVGEESAMAILHSYGTRSRDLLRYIESSPVWAQRLASDLPVVKAQVLHAVREEMALKLADVVFRRTDLGVFGLPSLDVLRATAEIMANELGWDQARVRQEIEEVKEVYAPLEGLN